MGYDTAFNGHFDISPPLTLPQVDQLNEFSNTRHEHEPGCPGIWCQWMPSDGGERLEWDTNEKFYKYVEWLKYLIEHFFSPWDRTLNGEVTWEGERQGDVGKILVKDNQVSVNRGRIVYDQERGK